MIRALTLTKARAGATLISFIIFFGRLQFRLPLEDRQKKLFSRSENLFIFVSIIFLSRRRLPYHNTAGRGKQ
jgi:hypothetical protein